jgi:hypothetical protein
MIHQLYRTAVQTGFVLSVLTTHESARAEDRQSDSNRLGPLQRLVGGQWVIQGHWSSGEGLRARSVYEWGVGKQIITAKTFVMNGDKEYQRYEGVLAWHPRKKSLVEFSFAYNGDLSELMVEAKDKDTIYIGWTPFAEGQASNVRQILKFKDDNSFVWTVSIKNGDKWQQIMEGTWNRQEK